MNDTMYRDFDAWYAQQAMRHIKFRLRGHEYSVPADPPAVAVLRAARLAGDQSRQLTAAEIAEIAELLIGADTWQEILASGATITEIAALLEWLVEQYNAGDQSDGDNQSTG
jgi:hypothetical protein